ncbi:MAG: hypothetical protein KDA64_17500 [Rhodospirillaceae bacterium]|nr:hypothetical protein [Rhodospirillaceae bacterium]
MRHRPPPLHLAGLGFAVVAAAAGPALAEDPAFFFSDLPGVEAAPQLARIEADVFNPLYVAPGDVGTLGPFGGDGAPAVDPLPVETEDLPPLELPPQDAEEPAQTAPDPVEPDTLVPEEAAPEEAVPDEVVPEDAAPEEPLEEPPAAPEPEETAPDAPARDEAPAEAPEPEESAPADAVPVVTPPGLRPPEHAEPEEPAPDPSAPQESLPAETAPPQPPGPAEAAEPAVDPMPVEIDELPPLVLPAPAGPEEPDAAPPEPAAPIGPPAPDTPATIAPLGDWVGAGRHCIAGFAITLPEGVEGLSFALGMEFRTTEGQDLGEFVTGPAEGAPGFDSFIEGMISHEGCHPTSTLTIDGPAVVPNSPFHALRAEVTCRLPDGTFGMDITRFSFNDGGRVALMLLLFGDHGWEISGASIPEDAALGYDAAAPLFDIMVQQMDYCPLEALEEN